MRSILITGASSGIGKACVLHFIAKGFNVYAGVRTTEDGRRLLTEANSLPPNSSYGSKSFLEPILLDINDPAMIDQAVALIEKRSSNGLYGLINNAGVAVGGPLELINREQIRKIVDVNVIGTITLTQSLIPLIRTGRGRIINIGSVSGIFSPPGLSVYAASKYAIEGFSDALRVELATFGIKVVVIEPGKIDTPIWSKALEMKTPERLSDNQFPSYLQLIEYYKQYAQFEKVTPMHVLITSVDHALTSNNPKVRYLIGVSSHVRSILRFLPTRLRDIIVRKAMKL